jgi:hypothetical protein
MFKPGDLVKIRPNSFIETVGDDGTFSAEWTSQIYAALIISTSYKIIESIDDVTTLYVVFITNHRQLYLVREQDLIDIDELDDDGKWRKWLKEIICSL